MADTWMDMDEPAPAQPAKMRAVEQTANAGMNRDQLQVQLTHMILTMQNTQQARLVASAVWHTYMGDESLVTAPMATTKKFADQTRGQSGHKYGSPHVQAWRSWTTDLATKAEAVDTGKEQENGMAAAITVLKKHIAEYEQATPKNGHRFIAQFRARLTKEQKGVVQYCLSSLMEPSAKQQLDSALAVILEGLKAEYKVGTAPASECERKLQTAIDDTKRALGIKQQK